MSMIDVILDGEKERSELQASDSGWYQLGTILKAQQELADLHVRIAELEQQKAAITLYANQVNSYAQEMSGTVGKYREQIEGERAAATANGAMTAEYEVEIREAMMAVYKYEQQVRSYEVDAMLYQGNIAAYNAKVTAILQEAGGTSTQIQNYLDIAGRYLAAGQAKINEMLVSLGFKPELHMQKSSSEQRS